MRQAYPAVRIVGNAKTLQMIEGYYGIACGTVEVREGDVLDLGGCISVLTSVRPTPISKGNGVHSNLCKVEKA